MFDIRNSSNRRFWLTSLLLLAFAASALAQAPEGKAKKPRKPKKDKDKPPVTAPAENPPPAPPAAPNPAIAAVERKLLAYETQAARQQLESSGAAAEAAGSVALGRVLIQEKKFSQADTELHKAANMAPDDPAPWVAMGTAHQYARHRDDANNAFTKAAQLAQARIDRNGQDAQAHLALGVAKQNLSQFDAAYSSLERARQLDPSNAEAVYQLGLTRFYQERWAEALDLFNQALAMNSQVAYAYYYRGQAASKTGNKSLLVDDLNRFLGMAPGAPEAPLAQTILQSAGR